jgi:translation initiation factor 4A
MSEEKSSNTFIKEENEEDMSINKWDDLDIDPSLLRGIYNYGLEDPSPIQKKAIKPIMKGRDVIAQAQSGTGKTATFTIGSLSLVDVTVPNTQVLILSPTHELSRQIANVMNGIGSMMDGLSIKVLVGGCSIDSDIDSLKTNTPHVIVGCPGRVYDMIRRNHVNTYDIKLIVLDEADEMLSSGFKEQVYNIFRYCNKDVQVALFSATLPEHIYAITSKFMRNPIKIEVVAEKLTLEGIKQYFVAVDDDREKYEVLKNLYATITMSQCIIYCNSLKRVIELYEAMEEDQFPVCAIHSGMEKIQRDNAFNEFKEGKARALISSNVTARGIDIQQVSFVINFDIPKDIHTYIHRIGRSGRWGRKGTAINFITRRDITKMKEIESYYNTQIDELPTNFSTN